MLLIVGLTKSVMVTVISGRKKSCILNESSFSLFFTLDKNFVLVWNVLQGVVQGDFSWPVKTRSQCSPENNHYYITFKHLKQNPLGREVAPYEVGKIDCWVEILVQNKIHPLLSLDSRFFKCSLDVNLIFETSSALK